MLHDIVEETKGEDAKKSIEAHSIDRFGDEITDEVMILTAPDIEDPDARRKSYSEKIGANPRVLRKKLSDRTHNILTDIVSLATTESTVEGLNRKKRYVIKTNQYFSNLFSGEKVPQEYRQLYKTVMKLA